MDFDWWECMELDKGFTRNELLEELKHLSDEDKKWALLLWVYICSGKDGINKIVEFIEKDREAKQGKG